MGPGTCPTTGYPVRNTKINMFIEYSFISEVTTGGYGGSVSLVIMRLQVPAQIASGMASRVKQLPNISCNKQEKICS